MKRLGQYLSNEMEILKSICDAESSLQVLTFYGDRGTAIAAGEDRIEVAGDVQAWLAGHGGELSGWGCNESLYRPNPNSLTFSFVPDDILHIKGETTLVARDNLLFEHGLLIGKLGDREHLWLSHGRKPLRSSLISRV